MKRRSPSHDGMTLPIRLGSVFAGAGGGAVAVAVGEVDIAESSDSEPLEAEKPRLPWWTSRPAGNMKRRSCQLEEGGDPDMVSRCS